MNFPLFICQSVSLILSFRYIPIWQLLLFILTNIYVDKVIHFHEAINN